MMPNTSQDQYVLTDVKFKKAAKNVHKQLNAKLTGERQISLGLVAQSMSQALFSMPYEEAKRTLLTNGTPIISNATIHKEDATAHISEHVEPLASYEDVMLTLDQYILSTLFNGKRVLDKQLIDVREAIFIADPLSKHLPLRLFPELTMIHNIITSIHHDRPGFLKIACSLHEEYMQKEKRGTPIMWEGRAATGISAHAKVFTILADASGQTSMLQGYSDSLAIDRFLDMALNESVPRMYRAGMYAILHSINYRHPTESEPAPKQAGATLEQMQYITMGPTHDIKKLMGHMENFRVA
jgi:hypothetical protein